MSEKERSRKRSGRMTDAPASARDTLVALVAQTRRVASEAPVDRPYSHLHLRHQVIMPWTRSR